MSPGDWIFYFMVGVVATACILISLDVIRIRRQRKGGG